ncbi:MAG: DinB family protein [Dehalococcoidia bacterium]|nr:DinB family protein [Dehalococcoidia bacterium]MCB9485385.1 DinB family protein [Thermoflexaceae bacterium]
MTTTRRIPDPTMMARLQLSVKGVDWAASLMAPFQHEEIDGEWSAHRHVFHLLGNERVFQERIRLAMEQDGAIFERWDSQRHAQDPYQKDSDIELLAEEFVGARTETFELFKSLTPEQWSRTFTWPDGRVCDMAWLGEKVLWHALDHFATLLDMHGHFAPLQASG